MVGAPQLGMVDIARQIRKPSAHHEPLPGTMPMVSSVGAAGRSGIRSVECVDCHNPHVTNDTQAEAPYASGMLRGVSGVDRNGLGIRSVTYEYEVCFKCHADNTPDLNYIPRVLGVTNLRRAFDPANSSYHPIVAMGKTLNIPSIPSAFEPNMTPTVMMYCTTCHADDEGGSRGPHGSAFPPILKERYETTDGTPESFDHYALCYRCHDRYSILGNTSFRKSVKTSKGGHSGHLAAGAPCSACHDAHGVNDVMGAVPAGTGSHTHLINFDTRIVFPKTGSQYPVFKDNGMFSGSCTLVCHSHVHDNSSYP
jgi:cytochrome c553